jgi:hypothetical protein
MHSDPNHANRMRVERRVNGAKVAKSGNQYT